MTVGCDAAGSLFTWSRTFTSAALIKCVLSENYQVSSRYSEYGRRLSAHPSRRTVSILIHRNAIPNFVAYATKFRRSSFDRTPLLLIHTARRTSNEQPHPLVLRLLRYVRFTPFDVPPIFAHAAVVQTLAAEDIRKAVNAALAEDVGTGDVTTLATIPAAATINAVMRAREPLVVAGIQVAEESFRQLSPQITLSRLAEDGQKVAAGAAILEISGPARPILSAERVALNFLQRLSGVATLTAQYVAALSGTKAQILDTRKTTPGWRQFEKYAVRCGGGQNHRFGLFDMVLIKDNHLASLKEAEPNAVSAAVRAARAACPNLKIEVEADTLEQVRQAVEAGADMVVLDNMNPVQLRLAVQACNGKIRTEASGGVTLATIRAIAETGVDFISVGALTHSARAVDIGLDFEM
jgi:nicotinate-nucleotide pyrophosphorylase (carboxylating)